MTDEPVQLTRADLAGMSAEDIVAAKATGQCRDLMAAPLEAVPDPPPPDPSMPAGTERVWQVGEEGRAWLRSQPAAEILRLRREGHCDSLTGDDAA